MLWRCNALTCVAHKHPIVLIVIIFIRELTVDVILTISTKCRRVPHLSQIHFFLVFHTKIGWLFRCVCMHLMRIWECIAFKWSRKFQITCCCESDETKMNGVGVCAARTRCKQSTIEWRSIEGTTHSRKYQPKKKHVFGILEWIFSWSAHVG